MRLNPNWKPYYHGDHEMGVKKHHTDMYQTEIESNIIAYWSICPDCKVVRTKRIIEYVNQDQDGLAVARVHEIIKDGKQI